MYEKTKNFCRLCGKTDTQIKIILHPENSSPDLCRTIKKHFSLQIEWTNQTVTTICNECKDFLLKLIEFEATVLRTQIKFKCYEIEKKKAEEIYISEEDHLLEEEHLIEDPLDEHPSNKPETQEDLEFSNKTCDETGNTQNQLWESHSSNTSDQSHLLKHRKSIHHPEAKRFVCDECGKPFKTSGDLARHKEFHRDDNDTPFACSICGKKFKSKLVRAMHQKRHSDNRCSCSICGLELKTKNTLRNHMLMHSGELKFKCDHCDKKFRHKKNLSVHLLTHSGVQPFTCAFCSQSFSLRFNLKTHQKKIHPEEMATYEREGKATIISDVVKKKFACGQREAKNFHST